MPFWNRLLEVLGFRRPDRFVFRAEHELLESLRNLAETEQRPADQVANDLLTHALVERRIAEGRMTRWGELSAREQQVAALVCLNYTNRQIAARLGISQETVKTHVRNVLTKFNLRSKEELRRDLNDWSFDAWV